MICAVFIGEGVYGIYAVNTKRSFDIDMLMNFTKYSNIVLQLSIIISILMEKYRIEGVLYDVKVDMGYSFVIYTALIILPQLCCWCAYFYVMNQYLMYTRSNPDKNLIGVVVIYQCYMPGVSNGGLANVFFKAVRRYSEDDGIEIEMIDLDKS